MLDRGHIIHTDTKYQQDYLRPFLGICLGRNPLVPDFVTNLDGLTLYDITSLLQLIEIKVDDIGNMKCIHIF